jgi:hypothetical protein
MNLTIQYVDLNYVNQVWPSVTDYLEDALVKGNDAPDWSECYNIHHVQTFVTSGIWMLLVASDEEGKIHGARYCVVCKLPNAPGRFYHLDWREDDCKPRHV